MARKPGKNGKSSTPTATTLLLPSAKVLDGLAETKRIQDNRSKNALGTYRQKLGESVEKDHVDSWSFGLASKMADMPDDVLHVRYFHLMDYLDKMGVTKRATAQEEMFTAGETGPAANGHAGKDDGEEDDETSAPRRIAAAARDVSEKAGARLHSET